MADLPMRDAVAVLAGAGALPQRIAEALSEQGRPYHIVGLADFPGEWIAAHPSTRLRLGEIGRFFALLDAQNVAEVTMAGGLSRPSLSHIRFDWEGVKLLPTVMRLFRGGDDGLLRGIAHILEARGYRVVAPDALLTDLRARDDLAVGPPLAEGARADAQRGFAILDALSPFDMGQAAVVSDGRCLAVEGPEGTAGMLTRVAALRSQGDPMGGVLVKAAKTEQDRRFDLPAIGPDTVDQAAAAGLSAIIVRAGGAIVLDHEDLRVRAQAQGVTVTALRLGAAS